MEMQIRANPEAGAAGESAKVIKRYANRKLYDTGTSRYVTLEEIGEMVKQGVEVQIVDNRSKGDLTSVTLAQIIFEEEKKKSRMPLEVLRDIIRNGGETISGFIQREVQPRVSSLREEAEAGLKLLRGEAPTDKATTDKAPTDKAPTDKAPPDRAPPDRAPIEKPRDLLWNLHATLQEWQARVDARLHAAVETVNAFPQIARELQQIAGRLGELENRIEHLELAPEITPPVAETGRRDPEPTLSAISEGGGTVPEERESH